MASASPAILAPAGDEDSFLAALAAGADAIYLGMKRFSARMQAKNFDIADLARLCELAAKQDCRVNVAFNNMLRQNELEDAWRLARGIAENTGVSGLIAQDLAMLEIARQAGFKGELTLSTLGALTDVSGLAVARSLGFDRVVLPRELSVDEMREMGESCPDGLELECFVHGALCYSVSGRCWWSSYMGGKSGLRGHCVQPCRRVYSKTVSGRPKGGERYFACQDLQLGELVKLLLAIPRVKVWKIEGRKKGPHYVYHTVVAYRMLRDFPDDAQKRKMALAILDSALGRPGVKARFLPRENRFPMNPGKPTGSGRLIGRVRCEPGGEVILKPQQDLLARDYLRIGAQDERWHALLPVSRAVPKGGTFNLRLPKHKTPRNGTPVYLVDRREPELEKLLSVLRAQLRALPQKAAPPVYGSLKLPTPCGYERRPDMEVQPRHGALHGENRFAKCLSARPLRGIWLIPGRTRHNRKHDAAYWLPPVIFPEQEADYKSAVSDLMRGGANCFVCNAPWQRAFFPAKSDSLELIAGPFCNIANSLAMYELQELGFSAAFASPELPEKDMLALAKASPLPAACVLGAFWPVSISRFGLSGVNVNEPFASPMGENFWARNNSGLIWIYPSWPLDICAMKSTLGAGGFSFFAVILENAPAGLPASRRPGLFNWAGELA